MDVRGLLTALDEIANAEMVESALLYAVQREAMIIRAETSEMRVRYFVLAKVFEQLAEALDSNATPEASPSSYADAIATTRALLDGPSGDMHALAALIDFARASDARH